MTTKLADPLTSAEPDRLFYSTGVLLEAADFVAEQTYHRSRLAVALEHLIGSGTVAGLRVRWMPAIAATSDKRAIEEHLRVEKGVAVDPLGRIIEVPRAACIRIGRWFDQQRVEHPEDMTQGWHGVPYNGVVVDVFIRFAVCERAKTPAMASGPFDALDAVVPSRLRDSYDLKLVIRTDALTDDQTKLPDAIWPTPAGEADEVTRLRSLHEAILAAPEADRDPTDRTAVTEDPNSVFLARLVIPATQTTPSTDSTLGSLPIRTDEPIRVDNFSRRFVYASSALASWLAFEDRPRNQVDPPVS